MSERDHGSVHNALTDERTCHELSPRYRNRRRCPYCPPDSGRKASHSGAASGAGMMYGCKWHVMTWVRNPNDL